LRCLQLQTDRRQSPNKFQQTDHKNQCGKNAGFRREMVGETENYRLYILIPFLYLSFIFPVFPYQNPQKIIYIFIENLIKLNSLKDFKKIYPIKIISALYYAIATYRGSKSYPPMYLFIYASLMEFNLVKFYFYKFTPLTCT
jgi:hypothetical protein